MRLPDALAEGYGEVVACTFEADDLTGVDVGHAEFEDCTFTGVSFAGISSSRISFEGCTFEACDFAGASLRQSYWGGCIVDDCRATGADLSKSFMRSTVWRGGSLSFATLAEGKLEAASFHGVDLSESLFQSVRLTKRSRFEHCTFMRSEIVGTHLRGLDLSTCDLAGIRVSDTFAELRGAIIAMDQAIDLVGLLGVRFRDDELS